MATTPRQPSVRSRGARRLTQATIGMVVLGVGGVAGVAIHDAHLAAASTNSPTQGSVTDSATDTTTGGTTNSAVTATNDGSGSALSTTQSTPQATSGGS